MVPREHLSTGSMIEVASGWRKIDKIGPFNKIIAPMLYRIGVRSSNPCFHRHAHERKVADAIKVTRLSRSSLFSKCVSVMWCCMTNAQIALVLVFCTTFCLMLLRDCANLYLHARKPPQTITAGELYKKGQGDNLLVEVTDVRFTGRYQKLFSSDRNGEKSSRSYGTCLEAVPTRTAGARVAGAGDINSDEKVLLRTLKTDEASVNALMAKTSFVGVYCNDLFDLSDEQRYFEKNGKSSKIPIVADYLEIPGAFKFYGLASGALLFSGLSFVFVRRAYRDYQQFVAARSQSLAQHLPPVDSDRIGASTGDFQKDLDRVQALFDMKRRDDAIQQLYGMMQCYSEHPVPPAFLAQILPDQYYAGALQLCRRAIASSPDTAYCHLVHAQLLRRRENWRDACAAIEEALRLEPDYIDALIEGCVIHVECNSLDKALSCAERGLELNAEDFALLNNKALVLREMKKTDEAAEVLSSALTIEPNNALAHYNIGLLHRQHKRREQALHHFKVALRLEPDNRTVRGQIGELSKGSPAGSLTMTALRTAGYLLGAPLVVAYALSLLKPFKPVKGIVLAIGFFLPGTAIQVASSCGTIPYLPALWVALRNLVPVYAPVIWGLPLLLLPWIPAALLMIFADKVQESIVQKEMTIDD